MSIAEVWEKGGNGGLELADKVLDTIENKESKFNPIYEETLSIKQKIETIAEEIYGAEGVDYSKEAEKQISEIEKLDLDKKPVCMAKLSILYQMMLNY